jgi:hypothetical protein
MKPARRPARAERKCERCGAAYRKANNHSHEQFSKRRYCGAACAAASYERKKRGAQ